MADDEAISYYIYDGDQVILETDATGTTTAKYIYGPGIDEPIQATSYTPQATSYYYHFDGLGSVTALTDTSGATVETYSYDAYGKPSIKDAAGSPLQASSLGNRFMFTAREYDSETGLYYYRARYYSPSDGRFLQRDPIGYIGGLNLYTYADNNPLNWIDPFGRYKEEGNKGNFKEGYMYGPDGKPIEPTGPEDPAPRPGVGGGWEPGFSWTAYLTEVGNVMVEEYPYTLNMQNIWGITSNVAGTGSMVSLIPKQIGYSHTHFIHGGRIAYHWANQYGSGVKFVTVAKVGAVGTLLGVISAAFTGYTIGATLRSYYVGYQRYREKHK